jgi:hypothetical protein
MLRADCSTLSARLEKQPLAVGWVLAYQPERVATAADTGVHLPLNTPVDHHTQD